MGVMIPADTDECFANFAKQIDRAQRGHDETAAWLYQRCVEERAMCLRDGDDLIVVELRPILGTTDTEMIVLCAASRAPRGFVARVAKEVDRIAYDLGAKRIRAFSNRKGLIAQIGHGWELKFVCAERRL